MRKLVGILTAVAAGSAGAMAFVAPAEAEIVFHEHPWYAGGYRELSLGYDPNLHDDTFSNGVVIGDNMSSFRNYFDWSTCLYQHVRYAGDVWAAHANGAWDFVPAHRDNWMSSYRAC